MSTNTKKPEIVNESSDYTTTVKNMMLWPSTEMTKFWTRIAKDQIESLDAMHNTMAEYSKSGLTRSQEDLHEAFRLGNSWVEYGTNIANEYRKMTLEISRTALSHFK